MPRLQRGLVLGSGRGGVLTVSRRLRVRFTGDGGARAVLSGLLQHGLRDGVHAVRCGDGDVVLGRAGGVRDVQREHVLDRRRGDVHGLPERSDFARRLDVLYRVWTQLRGLHVATDGPLVPYR